ncbi:MAG: hypothetical protein KJ587_11375 [Alphaproteobacteria bacterium]|nr:hypothetical protein [Alphaproteobacteria bacterium]
MQRRSKTLHVEMGLNDDAARCERPASGERRRPSQTPAKLANGTFVAGDASALDAFSRLLSKRNVELLKLIKEAKPQSVAELARLSGRPKASLMLTLRRFNTYGIVEFVETDGRRKVPRVACDRVRLDIPIA